MAWFTTSWAAAKLGAGLAGLPPGPGAESAGGLHVGPELLAEAGVGAAGAAAAGGLGARRLSGAHALPDSIVFSGRGRAVRRTFDPERVGAIGPVLADVVARTRAAPGTTLVAAGPVADAVLTFQANVVLVGGGAVVTGPTPEAALALAAAHDATAAALAPSALAELAALPAAAREALDVIGLRTVVTGGAPLTPAARDLVEDLFGPGALIDVYATADTGAIAVRCEDREHHVLLDGVEARLTHGGLVEIRSPLAASAGWVATGDRATLGGRELRLAAT